MELTIIGEGICRSELLSRERATSATASGTLYISQYST